jgi:hypothetical protein
MYDRFKIVFIENRNKGAGDFAGHWFQVSGFSSRVGLMHLT